MPKKTIDLEKSFSGALASQEIPALKQEIEKLKAQLQEAQGEIWLDIDKVRPNPEQPRRSFHDIEEFATLLNKEGQKEPILVVKVAEDDYMIFTGERRWRSGKLNNWPKIKAIVLPYNSETFNNDVLISSIQKENLNALDLSEALVKKISKFNSALDEQKVARSLNTAIVRCKRQEKQKVLGELITADTQQRKDYFEELGFTEEAQLICTVLLNLGLNPASVNQNQFPLLKLPEDLKEAIRNQGLGDGQARAIAKIEITKLNVSERKAQSLRSKLVEEVISQKLSVSKAQQLVKEEIAKYLEDSSPNISVPVQRCLKSVKNLDVSQLTDDEKQELIAVLQERLSELSHHQPNQANG